MIKNAKADDQQRNHRDGSDDAGEARRVLWAACVFSQLRVHRSERASISNRPRRKV